jgi:hypothetical protein
MATAKRKYYGHANATKCNVGPKSVNLVLDSRTACTLAGNLLNAVNAGARKIDIAVHLAKAMNAKTHVTVTSRAVA